MEAGPLENLIALVLRRTGLLIRPDEREPFGDKIQGRLKVLGSMEIVQYSAMLETTTAEALAEWNELVVLLTTGESYFFRNKDQMALLKNHILPELLALRQARRQLRIWSAGCSSGEEAYSLALLLHELLPAQNDWQILVLGTDINEKSLAKAKKGIYSQWSFRMVAGGVKEQYFTPQRDEWQIHEAIRTKVTFKRCNLVEDPFPSWSSELREMDLILCRNVFIYFDQGTVARVAEKFADTLSNGGYLLTGHGELLSRNIPGLNTRIIDEQVVLYKDQPQLVKTLPSDTWRAPLAGVPGEIRSGTFRGGKAKLRPEGMHQKISSPPAVLRPRAAVLPVEPSSHAMNGGKKTAARQPTAMGEGLAAFEATLQRAQGRANAGDYEAAMQDCRLAMQLAPTSGKPYFLLAQIEESRGHSGPAKESLNTVIYLEPEFVAAYIELGEIYVNEDNRRQAAKYWQAAQDILKVLPPEADVAAYAGMTAGELLRHVADKLLVSIRK